jgi:hypothetical protein
MSAHSELPPSSSDKWLKCHGWRVLNHGIPNTSSAAAEEGTLAHSLLEHLLLKSLRKKAGKRPPDIPEEMQDRIQAVVEWVLEQPGKLFPEARLDYGSQFGFVDLFGTSDVTLVEPNRITVADLKYGFGQVRPEWNSQLLIYLSAAVAHHGPRPNYRLVILQPRGGAPGESVYEWELTHADLEKFNKELEAAIAGSYGKQTLTYGDHCRHFCSALGRCPEAKKQTLKFLKEHPL